MGDLEDLAAIDRLDRDDASLFSRLIRELVSFCFVLRSEDERLYTFGVRNFHLVEAYFACMDAQVRKDEGLGVLAWRGPNENRLRLNQEETITAFILRLFYEEKRNSLRLSEYPLITVLDLTQRYKAMTGMDIKKTHLKELLKRFSRFRLIRAQDGINSEGSIILYPSLAFAIDQETIEKLRENLKVEETTP
ncbi:MAG TPA: DUF4194 domain-containing protein [Treponema sp.]|jgi:hypothetical protein|uniref:DUF4194 domain-containing protein n=1 Tax=Gracilinema caldarium TaxID=215591 RepID=UPI0016930DBD|nr:DUF4194 domain-containing protein [Gracilinema caldarium]NLJ08882.1 DUF4194 domain-containing protein [Treponema sp.]HON14183.1 DUF4194 domain-containing protein [Treponema sp.]HPC71713.1 DUF4194 domain-containing protein [Treponema sp.]HRS04373.1 DUF4194 domain-containing protein [Treponema sp.]HRU28768.1 DUF4194 domain-containing protein [Treponema sp.]